MQLRVLPGRIEINQGRQHEAALMQARMRNLEIRLPADALPIEEKIQIEGARTLAIMLIPPERPFNLTADCQQAPGCDVGVQLRDAIEKPVFPWMRMISNRFSLV